MNLGTIVVPADEARAKLAEYEESIRTNRNAQDLAIAAAYRAAARSLPVISLVATFAKAGYFSSGMPRLAIIRADAPECYVRWMHGDLVFGDRDDIFVNRGALVGSHSVRVHPAELPARRSPDWTAATTTVPLIPPHCRPRIRRLRGFHLLWEVKSWTRVPPEDPALLRHIMGDLWSVQATWDLTPLEQAVLAGR